MVMESRNAQRAVDPHSPDLKNAAFFLKNSKLFENTLFGMI